jgi:hypothetical protein
MILYDVVFCMSGSDIGTAPHADWSVALNKPYQSACVIHYLDSRSSHINSFSQYKIMEFDCNV